MSERHPGHEGVEQQGKEFELPTEEQLADSESVVVEQKEKTAEELVMEKAKEVFGESSSIQLEATGGDYFDFSVQSRIEINDDQVDPSQGDQEKGNIAVKMRGLTRGSSNIEFVVEDGSINYGGKEFKLEDGLPSGMFLIIRSEPAAFTAYPRFNYKPEVNVETLKKVDDIITLFHELGHAHDYKEGQMQQHISLTRVEKEKIETGDDLDAYPPRLVESKVRELARRERDAWARAFWMSQKAELPIKTRLLADADRCLATYDEYALHTKHVKTAESFSSSKSRKELRTPEGQEAIILLRDTAERLSDIKREFTKYVKDPTKLVYYEDKPISYLASFDDPAEIYADNSISKIVRQPGVKEWFGIRSSAKGGNSLYVTKNISPRLEKSELIESSELDEFPEVRERYTISVNSPTSLKDLQKVKGIIKEIFDGFDQDGLVVAAIQAEHPEWPKPPDIDSQDGHELTLQEKIKFMKKHKKV